MKLLRITLLTLSLYTQSTLAMYVAKDVAKACDHNDHAQRRRANLCDIGVNLTLTTAATTALNAHIMHKEYQQHGYSSRCVVLAGSLAVMSFMTGAMAYLASSNCSQ